jgi:plastocyanin
MPNLSKYFVQGLNKTLRLQSGVNFSYKGPWVQLYPNTVLDQWYYGDFCAAEYTVVVDFGGQDKEIIKFLVIADVNNANITEYGRTNLGRNLVDITAQVNASNISILINPAISEDSTASTGAKVIYSASYFHSINDIGASSVPSYLPPQEVVPTYTVTPATNSVDEGSPLTINVSTTNVEDATVLYWTASNASDFGTSSGSFTITSNTGSFTVTPTADSTTEGAETFTVSIRSDSINGTVLDTTNNITINDTSTTPIILPTYTATPATDNVDEGSALTINVATTNVDDATTLYWTVSSSGDFNIASGSFVITSNAGNFNVTPGNDFVTEDSETFTVSIRTGSILGTIVDTTDTITINDTSTTPTGIVYNVTVASGTNIYGTGNKYYIDGFVGPSPTLNLIEGQTYIFRQSDPSNDTHQLKFSTTPNGIWGGGIEYTTGVTTVGTAGTLGSYTQITVASDAPTLYYYCVNHSGMGGTANTPGEATPIYDSLSSPSNANEGDTITFSLLTQNIPDSTTVGYTITGITEDDISSGTLTGTITISNNTGSTSIVIDNDELIEGSEVVTCTIDATDSEGNNTGSLESETTIADTSIPTPTYTATPVSNSIDEGSALTINVATTNVDDSTTLYWTVTNAGDFGTASGNFTITSDAGSFTVTPTADSTTEGAETFTVSIRTESTSGTIVDTTDTITINDTSTTPADPPTYSLSPAENNIDEGSALTINVTTTNVDDGTTLYWTVTNAGDFDTTAGQVTINSNAGSFTVTPRADEFTEGAETFTVQLRTDSLVGTVVDTTDPININDTSTTPVFAADYTITVTNSGNSYLLSGSDRNGSFTNASQPTLAFNDGDLVQFNINSSTAVAHPFYIKTTQSTGTGNQVAGVTGAGSETVQWDTSVAGSGTYGYQCSIHFGMWNTITVT